MDQRSSSSGTLGRGEAYYRELLKEQEGSGQSVRAFAVAGGLSQRALYRWRVKLGLARSRRAARDRAAVAGKESGFVAVDVVGGSPAGGAIEVVLADGVCVRVPLNTGTERLVDLVRALRSC